MEDAPEVQEDLDNGGKFKNWLQDNIRIIFSVLIVVAIAAGIYSYSKRAESPLDQSEVAIEEFMEEEGMDAVTIIGDEDEDTEKSTETSTDETEETDAVKVDQSQQDSQISISEESDDAFIEAAIHGDSRTTLARKALGNFLEKNNDSSLTAEHKIYIEDYLQKYVGHEGGVYVGTEISFAKTLIRDAIEKSKTLDENQLDNLKKYSSRVSSF